LCLLQYITMLYRSLRFGASFYNSFFEKKSFRPLQLYTTNSYSNLSSEALLLLHPFLAKISEAMTCNALLAKRIVSLDCQYISLKITCTKEVTCFFLKNQVITCTPNSPDKSSSPLRKSIICLSCLCQLTNNLEPHFIK